jgi:hypothetical protein
MIVAEIHKSRYYDTYSNEIRQTQKDDENIHK